MVPFFEQLLRKCTLIWELFLSSYMRKCTIIVHFFDTWKGKITVLVSIIILGKIHNIYVYFLTQLRRFPCISWEFRGHKASTLPFDFGKFYKEDMILKACFIESLLFLSVATILYIYHKSVSLCAWFISFLLKNAHYHQECQEGLGVETCKL